MSKREIRDEKEMRNKGKLAKEKRGGSKKKIKV